jgi:hypothetical protein
VGVEVGADPLRTVVCLKGIIIPVPSRNALIFGLEITGVLRGFPYLTFLFCPSARAIGAFCFLACCHRSPFE